MSENTGGPAFPAIDNWRVDSGMTLRDYFAAHCMQASLGASLQMNLNAFQAAQYAKFAYMAADAMLQARET